jgi:phosphotransferase system HPr (HPr) family protein
MSGRRPEDETVASRAVTISNPLGLHARPAAEFARHARAFRAEVWLVKDGRRYSAASLIEILRANLLQGATATIEAKGRDAEKAVERLAQLVRQFKD